VTAPALGFDFGTTNSAMALAVPGQAPRVTPPFRSILFFDPDERGKDRRPLAVVGPEAIERHLASDGSGRLIQSMKSHLASRQFRATSIFGVTYTLEDLIALVARGVARLAEAQLGPLPRRVLVGRPVVFAGSEDGQAQALERLEKAVRAAGFDDIAFCDEPIAAAAHYERRLDHDELVLIGDFGGGTSDFCLMRVGPGARGLPRERRLLGTQGVALAGDAFDGRLVRRLVAPALGLGTTYQAHGKAMPVPPWLYTELERWHHLSFLKSRDTLKLLDDIEAGASAPGRIAAFRHLVDAELGYQLARAVERTKVALSREPRDRLTFTDEPVRLDEPVLRTDFEAWIAGELAAVEACVDRLLAGAGVTPAEVDRVFLTGGSSLVPAVRALFVRRFGAARLEGGDELTSVASGLALLAGDGLA
jgi:hypothetical chaperone protein